MIQVSGVTTEWRSARLCWHKRQSRRESFKLAREGYVANVTAYQHNRYIMIRVAEEYARVSQQLNTHIIQPRRGYSAPHGYREYVRGGFLHVAEHSRALVHEIDDLISQTPLYEHQLERLIAVIDKIAEQRVHLREYQKVMRDFRNGYFMTPATRRNQPRGSNRKSSRNSFIISLFLG